MQPSLSKQVGIEPREFLVLCLLWRRSLFVFCQWSFFIQWYTYKESFATQQCITQWQKEVISLPRIERIWFLSLCFIMKMWLLLEHWRGHRWGSGHCNTGERTQCKCFKNMIMHFETTLVQSGSTGAWWIGMIRICVAFRVAKYIYLAFKQAEIDWNIVLSLSEKDVTLREPPNQTSKALFTVSRV